MCHCEEAEGRRGNPTIRGLPPFLWIARLLRSLAMTNGDFVGSLLDEPGLELDLGAGERFRHRAVRLRRLGLLLEGRLVDARHTRLGRERDARNREAAVPLLDVHGRHGVDALRRVAGIADGAALRSYPIAVEGEDFELT